MIIFILVLALILAIVAVVFALQNPTVVTAVFFTLGMKGPLALFVLGGVGVGILIGVLAMLPSVLQNAMKVSQHRRQISSLQKSLDAQSSRTSAVEGPASGEETESR